MEVPVDIGVHSGTLTPVYENDDLFRGVSGAQELFRFHFQSAELRF